MRWTKIRSFWVWVGLCVAIFLLDHFVEPGVGALTYFLGAVVVALCAFGYAFWQRSREQDGQEGDR